MRFSQRHGYAPVRSVLQTGSVDEGLRNRLWNAICSTFFSEAPERDSNVIHGNYLPNNHDVRHLLEHLWHDYFKSPTDTIGPSYFQAMKKFRTYFFECEWYSIYDLIEFFKDSSSEWLERDKFITTVNAVLKEELAGYRFVSERIVPVTSEEEVAAIEAALALPDGLKPVKDHLRQGLTLLADKKSPDYRNSIKESISAIESLSKILSGLPGATLTSALNAVDKHANLHPALKEAFQRLYGYTSDAQGIRHALMDEPTLDIEDAKFMLVSCSAFANYMVVKAQKAGITL